MWTLFKDANFAIFSVDFFTVKFEREIIGIKIQISIVCFEKIFLEKSISHRNRSIG